MVYMRRGSKRTANNSVKGDPSPTKASQPTRDLIARIRKRREQIYQREGILSDSAILIREDRDR
jgi:hypothetical protein